MAPPGKNTTEGYYGNGHPWIILHVSTPLCNLSLLPLSSRGGIYCSTFFLIFLLKSGLILWLALTNNYGWSDTVGVPEPRPQEALQLTLVSLLPSWNFETAMLGESAGYLPGAWEVMWSRTKALQPTASPVGSWVNPFGCSSFSWLPLPAAAPVSPGETRRTSQSIHRIRNKKPLL